MERLRSIAKEAAEQSGRGKIPSIDEPVIFGDALKGATGINIFFDTASTSSLEKNDGDLSLWVGPEGGWSDDEKRMAQQKKFHLSSCHSFHQ